MKTLLRHLNEVSQEKGFKDFNFATEYGVVYVVESIIKEAGDRYAIEVARQALENASEKSQDMMYYVDEPDTDNVDILGFKHRRIQSCYAVPKQSILNESNIPKL